MACRRCGSACSGGTCGDCLDRICRCGWSLRVTLTIVGFVMVVGGYISVILGARSDDEVLQLVTELGGGSSGILGGLLMAVPNFQREAAGEIEDIERRLAALEAGDVSLEETSSSTSYDAEESSQ